MLTQKQMDEMMIAVQAEVQRIMQDFMDAQMEGREYLKQAEVDNGEVYSQAG